jgi:hypothetical protein
MNEKRIKWKKKIPRASCLHSNSSLLLVEFQAFDSYKNRVGHFKLLEYGGLANGIYFVFQLINKVPPAPLGHHYYSPVGGLSRIWIRNFTWIVGERSKEDKIFSLSLKTLQTFPTVCRVPPYSPLSVNIYP